MHLIFRDLPGTSGQNDHRKGMLPRGRVLFLGSSIAMENQAPKKAVKTQGDEPLSHERTVSKIMSPKILNLGLLLAVCLGVNGCATCKKACGASGSHKSSCEAPEKLLRFTGTVDGSGRIAFTRDSVRYEHKHWKEPWNITFNGVAWPDLNQNPPGWTDLSSELDLSRAHITERTGRDVIALEPTADGFNLYLSDTPNGADDYTATIAIPWQK